jgi:hypothetical protein
VKPLGSVKVPDNVRAPIAIPDYTNANHKILSQSKIREFPGRGDEVLFKLFQAAALLSYKEDMAGPGKISRRKGV